MLQQHVHCAWVTTIIKLIIFVAYGACWVCLCCRNPSNSDMDYRIFIVRTGVNACDFPLISTPQKTSDSGIPISDLRKRWTSTSRPHILVCPFQTSANGIPPQQTVRFWKSHFNLWKKKKKLSKQALWSWYTHFEFRKKNTTTNQRPPILAYWFAPPQKVYCGNETSGPNTPIPDLRKRHTTTTRSPQVMAHQ